MIDNTYYVHKFNELTQEIEKITESDATKDFAEEVILLDITDAKNLIEMIIKFTEQDAAGIDAFVEDGTINSDELLSYERLIDKVEIYERDFREE